MKKFDKLCYSFGAVATALSYQAFSTYIIFFYVDTLRLEAKLAAVAMLIYGVWNAVNDPVAGFISDITKTKYGRRIPYIFIGAVPFGAIFFLVWVCPFGASNMTALFYYFLISICLFDGLYTVVVLNWASLFPEMYPSVAERAEVNSYRQTFGMAGLVLGVALPPLIYSTVGWPAMGAMFGALITISCFVALIGSREKRLSSRKEPLRLLEAVKATFRNFPFITFVTSNLLIQYAFTMVLAMIPFYAKYVLEARAALTSVILLAAFLVAIPMMFVWRAFVARSGAKRCYMYSIALFILALIPFIFIKSPGAAIVSSAFIGAGLAGIILLSDVIISDVIDHDERSTGRRREGMYFGVNAFVTRFAIAMEAFSIGVVFSRSGYDPIVFSQRPAFLAGLRLLVAGLPIAALVLAFVIMIFYPLPEGARQ